MNQLSSFMVLNIDGGDRLSFTYNVLDENGELISGNNKKSFYVLDEEIIEHINAIRNYIKEKHLS